MKSLLQSFSILIALFLFSFQQVEARVDIIHISVNDPKCFGSSDGYVVIDSLTTTAPSGDYTIRINTTPAQFFNVGDTIQLGDGNYTITVFDGDDGNTPSFRSFSIDEPFQLVTATVSNEVSCFGDCDGDATVFGFDGTPPYTYQWDDPLSQTSQTASNLCGGMYHVTVTDDNGCTAVDSVLVGEPSQVQPNVSVTDVDCFGNSTGSATAVPTGGTGTYVNYQWSSSANNTATESNLSAGTYSVTVTDSDGCTNTETFTVSQPAAALSVSLSKSDVFCFGDSTGFINTSVSGGTTPYTYSWNDGVTTQNRNNIPAGSYTVTVTDNNSCTETASVTVNQRPDILITFNVTDVSCNGDSTGSITANPSGGTPPFSGYAWSNGGNSQTITNVPAGSYTVTVTDVLGCTKVASTTVSEPTLLSASINSTTDPSCVGGSDGAIDLQVSGGTTPYTYSWGDGPTSQDRSGLSQGSYSVTITDNNGCTDTTSAILNDPPPILPNVTTTDVLCFGGSDGTAQASPSGGSGIYVDFQWSSSGNNTSNESGLSAGTYTVTVTDDEGCTGSETFTIGEPATAVSASIPSKSDVFCFGETTGFARAQGSGGTVAGNYSFQWDDSANQTTAQANNLGAGTYTVTVTDDNGCTATASVTINSRPAINISFASTDVSCNGGNDGSATATISGGTPNFSWVWSHGPSGTGASSTVNNLSAGVYTITVTDALSCTEVDSVVIDEPTQLNAQIDSETDPLCNGGSDGAIDLSVSGGTSPYTYLWNDGPTSQDRNSLTSGNYEVTVTDNNGCAEIVSTTLSDPALLTVSIDSTEDASCNGLSDGFARAAANGGTGAYTYSWDNGPTTAENPNLGAGSYEVTVTDNNGCTATTTATISAPLAVSASINSTDASCAGINDGSATANGSGGTTPYTYLWSNSATTQTINNLSGGTYDVTITDNNGCTDAASVTINQPSALSLTTSGVDLNCNANNSGSATVTASGGTPAYTYSWDDPSSQTTATATNLNAGTYRVTVTDNNGCTAVDSVTLSQPSAINAAITSTIDPDCNGANTGSATVSASGGTGALTYLWNDAANQTTATASNLTAGVYTVTITDNNGCTATAQATLNDPAAIQINLDSLRDVSCFNGSDGSISVTVSGGTTPYTYNWNDGPTTQNRTNLSANTYILTVTDNNGCSSNQSFTVNEPASALSSSISSSTDVSCNGAADGSIDLTVSGGTSPYTYLWNDAATTEDRNGLNGGTYDVTVTDNNGCSTTESVSVNEPAPILISVDSQTDALCNGSADGTATVSANGGSTPYIFNWSNGGNGNSQNNLSAGTYYITVTDNNNCQNVDSVLIGEPSPLIINVDSVRNVSCNGGADGQIIVSGSGGTSPYNYSWSTGGSGVTQSNLSAGTYSVTVTDNNNCQFVDSFVVSEPAPLTATLSTTNEQCVGANDGEITANPNGGTAPYAYLWSNSDTTQTISNLSPGSYAVTVSDDNGCTTTASTTVNPANPIFMSASGTDVSCNGDNDGAMIVLAFGGAGGFSYAWSDAVNGAIRNNVSAGKYYVTATDANGCTSVDSVTINEPDTLKPNLSVIDASCSGVNDGSATSTPTGGTTPYTYNWSSGGSTNSVSNLAAGNYSVTVTDANGCDTVQNFVIDASPANFTFVDSVSNNPCFGDCVGSILISSLSGGTAPYNFTWSNGAGNVSGQTGLCAGTYTVTIADANGCDSVHNITITEPTQLALSITGTDESCSPGGDGTATANVNGGTTPYTYNWSNGQSTASINNLIAGNYLLTVTDANGCDTIQSVTIGGSGGTGGFTFVDSVSNNPCFGDCVGTIQILNLSGGTSPYNFTWSNGAGNVSAQGGLCAGTYTVTIADANGCDSVHSITITEPIQLAVSVVTTDESCSPGGDGTAIATVSGGTTPYTYNWSNGQSTDTIVGLTAGSYTLTITDANGCDTIQSVTIGGGGVANISLNETVIDASCSGICDGGVSLNPNGGTTPYTYLWSDNSTQQSLGAVCSGTYSVTVSDVNGCSAVDTFIVNDQTTLIANITTVDDTCLLGVGSAAVTMNGGVAPYTYSWSSGGSAQTETSLLAGSYDVTVVDDNGCSVVENFTIQNFSSLFANLTINNETCNYKNDGSITVNASGGTNPLTYNWSNGLTGAFINNLSSGTYVLTITDASGCAEVDTAVITEPNSIVINFNTIDESCSPGGDGAATATVTGGTPPYTYNWSAGTASGNTTTGLVAGTYQLALIDSQGCGTTVSFTIGNLPPFSVNVNTVDAKCNGGTDGEIDLSVSGGLAPYSYNWSAGLPSQEDHVGLAAGNYSVTITDATPCSEVVNVTITEEDPFIVDVTTYEASCSPGDDGSAKIEVSGGVSPYSYSWSGGTDLGDSLADLSPGSYSVTITDDNGCTKVEGFGIVGGSDIDPGVTTTLPTCFGDADGSISLNPSGSSNPNPVYTYLWDDNSTQSSRTGLTSGLYRVTISDNNTPPCTKVENIVLSQPGRINASFNTSDESCSPGNDGTATAAVTGGTSPYTYNWSAGSGSGSTVSGLTAGSYDVTITDDNGCQKVESFTIDPSPSFNISLSGVDASCFGESNGSISVSVSGAVNPLTYDWQPPLGGGATPSVGAGKYYLTVTDGNGCQETDSIEIGGAAPILTNMVVVDESCANGNDGSATVSPSDGQSPYTYLWSDNSTSSSINNLNSGGYYVTITDANGCSIVDTANVSSGQEIQLNETITDASCKGNCDGTIDLNPTGGQAPYTYNWSNASTSSQITNLCEGNYTVTVSDDNGCSNIETYTIVAPASIVANITKTDESCSPGSDASATANPSGGTAPYTYQWSSGGNNQTENGLTAGNYSVTITDDNNCELIENFTIIQPNNLVISVGPIIDVSCNGASDGEVYIQVSGNIGTLSYNWDTGLPNRRNQLNLSAGTYNVTVTDRANGCTQTASVSIDEPSPITTTVNTTPESCVPGNDGTISVNANGGTITTDYTYTWSNGLPSSQIQSGLSAGTYTVTISDDNGCDVIETINVGNVAPFNVDSVITDVSCNGGSDGEIDITVTGVTGIPTFNWDNSLPPNEDQSNLSAGTYNVTVTDTSNGCVETMTIVVDEPLNIVVSAVVTTESCSPGSDGEIDLSVSGGTVATNYSYTWDNGLAAQEDQTGLQAGTYTVTVTDDNGCSVVETINVGSSAPFTLSSTITDVSCKSGADGAIDLTVSGAGGTPTFAWSNGLASQEDQNGLFAGSYSVTVTDPSSGCTATSSFVINEPDTIQANIAVTEESCVPGNDGTITLNVSGGTVSGNYFYQWTNGLPSQRNQVQLTAGTYTVTITDDNGCFIVKQATVGSSAPFTVDSIITDASCNGGNDGTINLTVNGTGGTPTFTWSNGLPSQEDQANLSAGTYRVTITDPNNGCSESLSFIVDEPNSIVSNFNVDDESCTPGNDGEITAIVSGGTSPYTYNWSNSSTTQQISNLTAGVYYLTITDGNNCSHVDSARVNSAAPFTLSNSVTNVSCNGGVDGAIDLTVTGTGTAPTFAWSSGLPNTEDQSNLSAGTYLVTVTDPSDGCTETALITVNEPSPLAVNVNEVPVSCGGGADGSAVAQATGGTSPYSYAWSNGVFTPSNSSLSVGTYLVTVTDDNGCTKVDSAVINQGSNLLASVSVVDESCIGNCDGNATVNVTTGIAPYTYAWSFGGPNLPSRGFLCAGNYDVTVTDAAGCDTTIDFTVNSGIVNYTIASTNESCQGTGCDGTATVTTTGTYSYTWSPAPGAGQGTNQVSGLCAGKYFVTISNGSGCNVVDSVEIDPFTPILPNEVVTDEGCGNNCDGRIELNPTGGSSSTYTYNWSPVPGNGQGVQNATGLCAGNYSVTITDAAACDTVLNITIQAGNTLNADIVTKNQSCGILAVCDGEAYATVTSGTAPYTYIWSVGTPSGPNGDTIKSVCAGTNYTVTITDATGCSTVDTFDIGRPTPITATFTATNSTCNICDGELVVDASGGSGNYSYLWLDQNGDTLNNSDTTQNLCAGIYFVEITDDSGCSVTLSTSLSDNGAESLTATSTDASCYGSCDGEASVNFNCNDPSCQIDWIDASTGLSIGQNGNTASGLCAGDYFVEVTNNSGCIALEQITIGEPSPFVITPNVIQPTCAASCSGSISLSVSGGAGGTYSYNWSPAPGSGQGTSTISNLCTGNYQVTVTDAVGCDTVLSINVGATTAMTATFSTVNANCGQSDGSITATVNGGSVLNDYQYQWFDGANNLLAGETTPIIDNIPSGNYTLRTEDDNQCVEFFTTVLGNIGGPSIIVDSIQDVNCLGDQSGAVAISVSGGTAPYTYDWLPNGASTQDLNNVIAGNYTVKVTDAAGCITTENVQINDGNQVQASVETTNAECGACDGTAKLNIVGNAASYSFLWSNGATTDSIANLCSGEHSVKVTDSLGCSETYYFTINNIGGPSDAIVTATAASCASACDGTVTIQPIGGGAPYTYSWMHSSLDTNAFDNLCVGDYTVQITDVRGCAKVVNFSIGSPSDLIISENITSSSCNTFPCNGSIFLNVKGGTAPYSYNWGPTPQNDSNFVGSLCAGIYNVTVTDANGCSESLSMNVSNNGSPVNASPSTSPESCFGSCDGSLISGLTASSSLTFQWLNEDGLAVAAQDSNLVDGACAGTYFLEVTSLPDGCLTTYEVEVEAADSISLAASIVKPISCVDACDGIVSVSSKGGELAFSYSWNDPNQQAVIPAEGLCAGTYTVTGTDANGCTKTLDIVLNNPDTLELAILAEGGVGCSSDCEGTASVLASGGNSPYTYTWSGGQSGTDPTDLCFGANIITVTDATGCSVSDTVYISATDTVVAQVPTNTVICEGDSVYLDGTILGSGVTSFAWYNADTTIFTTSEDTTLLLGVGNYRYILIATNGSCSDTTFYDFSVVENPSVGLAASMAIYKDEIKKIRVDNQDSVYQYYWSPGTNLSDSTIAEPTTDTRESITYVLNVIDTTGCNFNDSIRVVYYPDLEVPSGFSPNGDGTNDVWNIRMLEEFPNASVKVYNRWGELLFEQTNGYKEPWDGKFNGEKLPVGTYYYVIDLKDSRYENLTGPITIIK